MKMIIDKTAAAEKLDSRFYDNLREGNEGR
jgi:hypothetical protein